MPVAPASVWPGQHDLHAVRASALDWNPSRMAERPRLEREYPRAGLWCGERRTIATGPPQHTQGVERNPDQSNRDSSNDEDEHRNPKEVRPKSSRKESEQAEISPRTSQSIKPTARLGSNRHPSSRLSIRRPHLAH